MKNDITCVCLNPAIDKIVIIDQFNPGELYRVDNQHIMLTPGGKAINVAKVLQTLGHKTIVTGFIAGSAGIWIKSEVESMGVSTDFIEIEGETRTNLNIIDGKSNRETEILEKGPKVFPDQLQNLIEKIKILAKTSRVMVFSGGLPEGVPPDIYAALIEIAKSYDVKTVLDASGEALEEGVKASPTLIKPNLRELSTLVGKPLLEQEEVIEASKNIIKKHGIQYVMASIGARGAILTKIVDGAFQCKQAKPPKAKIVNTIGSGDAMVAGIAVGLANAWVDEEMLSLGIACATSNAQLREVGQVDLKQTQKFIKQIHMSK